MTTTAPTLASAKNSSTSYAGNKTITSVSWSAGDVIVLTISATAGSVTAAPTDNSSSPLSWTKQQEATASGSAGFTIYTATAVATASGVTITETHASSYWFFSVYVFSGSDGIGASNKAGATSGSPTVTLTTTGDHSALVYVNEDRNGVAGTITYDTINSTTATEQANFQGTSCGYQAYWLDAGTAGSVTAGMSSPSPQKYQNGVVEVLGHASSAVNATVTPPTGTATVTGQTPTVSATRVPTVVAPAGSFATTGHAPVVAGVSNQTVLPPVGTLTVTGHAPTVSAGTNATESPPAGTVSVTGHAPTVAGVRNVTVTPPTGTISVEGHAPAVAAGGSAEFAADTGTFVVVGHAPTVHATSSPTVIVGNAGQIMTSGFVPDVSVGYPSYRFTPPTYKVVSLIPDTISRMYWHFERGISIYRDNGVLTEHRNPNDDVLANSGVEGVDWFRGGHDYIVSHATAVELQNDGWDVTIIP